MADGIFPNKKSCFCQYGYFGPTCKEESGTAYAEDDCFRHLGNNTIPDSFKYGMFDEKCFKKFDLENGDFLYSRTVKDQVEIIMDYKTESYVALGWRPHQIPKTCRLFPDLNQGDARQGGKTAGYCEFLFEICAKNLLFLKQFLKFTYLFEIKVYRFEVKIKSIQFYNILF